MYLMKLDRKHYLKHWLKRYEYPHYVLNFSVSYVSMILNCHVVINSHCHSVHLHNLVTVSLVLKLAHCCRNVSQFFLMKILFANIIMVIATTFCGLFSTISGFPMKTALQPLVVSSPNLMHIRRQIKCLLML